ncbi:MAG: HEPN domain-containing protein [Flavobacterium sp.]
MAYSDKFIATDTLITRLNPIIATVIDPDVRNSYAGLLSVSAITAYELAIKEICIAFSEKKHKVFGTVMEAHFSRLNGRIKYSALRGEIIKPFGKNYLDRFDNKMKRIERLKLTGPTHVSAIAQYDNLIQCRHGFVHGGNILLTPNEVIQAFSNGKDIIHCLHSSMVR